VQLTREAARTTERSNFLVFAYVGFALTITQGFFYRRLVKRVGELRFMRVGLTFMMLGIAGATVFLLVRPPEPRPALLASALGVMTIAVAGFGMLNPSVLSLISRWADPKRQGEILGVNQSGSALARILGPAFALPLFKVTPSHMLPFAVGACLLVCAFALSLRIPPR
jgi:MFS family permease